MTQERSGTIRARFNHSKKLLREHKTVILFWVEFMKPAHNQSHRLEEHSQKYLKTVYLGYTSCHTGSSANSESFSDS